jgi:hydroxymethylpyrimidine/phosphomethylpyrimidine kinase
MQKQRPFVLTIAGFDPSAGAGILADIKTFEQLGVYGLAICTGNTLQSETDFVYVKWRRQSRVEEEINFLLENYPVTAVKTGIVPSFDFLERVVDLIRSNSSEIKIVVDPVCKSTTGFEFTDAKLSANLLEKITLLTPNIPEARKLFGKRNPQPNSSVLVTGGHDADDPGTDRLYVNGSTMDLLPQKISPTPKHGSGCVLSAAITAFLALGEPLDLACAKAKRYAENFLNSNKSLLGYHAS